MPTTLEQKTIKVIPHLDPEMFVGMSYGDAKLQIEGAGYACKTVLTTVRPTWRYMRSYDPLVINIVVDNNRVTAAFKG